MKRFLSLICASLLLTTAVFAQDADSDENSQNSFSKEYKLNEAGDQYIKIGLMVTKPLNFTVDGEEKLLLGGAGTLGYHRFITQYLIAGLDVHFGYNPTLGENIFTQVPAIITVTFQPTLGRFEFPMTLGAGFGMESYLNRTYFPGLVIKPQAGVFFRISPSWSLGIEGDFTLMPQWYSDSSNNFCGMFGSVVASVRYHF